MSEHIGVSSHGSRLRIALFADSFHEINGVGTLAREYAAYAERQGWPFLCVYGGTETRFTQSGSLEQLQLRRGLLSFAVDANIQCDPFLARHRNLVTARLLKFRPDLVHITGPSDVSTLGFWAANLAGVPVVSSWHTNLHDYASRRLASACSMVPQPLLQSVCRRVNAATLWALAKWYRLAHFVMAPNQDMVELLRQRTGRPSFLMGHGVDTTLFSPDRRNRADTCFRIGYVGRLTPEKNVRALAELEQQLFAAGQRDFRTVLVGDGSEREWLGANMQTAEFLGVLHGLDLATAFANMDVFVFPSLTDTFGLVLLEAMSSGVPVVVRPEAGHNAGIVDGETGFHSRDFCATVRRLMMDASAGRTVSVAARAHALSRGWDAIFADLHRIYTAGLASEEVIRRMPTPRFGPAEP